jgi:hypothetical protein
VVDTRNGLGCQWRSECRPGGEFGAPRLQRGSGESRGTRVFLRLVMEFATMPRKRYLPFDPPGELAP